MLANNSALLHVQPSLCLHKTKKMPSLKPTQEKNPNLAPCSATLGIKNSNIPLASPKEKNLGLLAARCNSALAE
jgi:hypothetical protein